MKISVVGTGYVGLVTGVCLSEVGHDVTCVDTDEDKIRKLRDGKIPIYEPGLEGLIKRNVDHERLRFTTDLGESLEGGTECVFIAVGTPPGEDGSADLKYVKKVAEDVGQLMRGNLVVVVKSTVPVGTCDVVEQVLGEALASRKSKLKATVASNPEFLKEGAAIDDFMKPERIIVGVDGETAEDCFKEIYRPFILDDPGKLFVMDRYSSELTKYGSNAMLATRISFMNELSRLCEKVGANVDNVRRGIGSDPRIGKKFLFPGPGYGGSCFPKDVDALIRTSRDQGLEMEVLEAVANANRSQKRWVAERIVNHLGDMKGRRIAVWGLAFKPGTDDVRETPAKTIVETLLDQGAEVIGHDPEAIHTFQRDVGERAKLTYAQEAYDALEGADALVLVTEWSEYKRPNWEKVKKLMRGQAVFDFRNQYERNLLERQGFYYECIGRPDSRSPLDAGS